MVKFAYDNRHIVCLGYTNKFKMMVYLIDSKYSAILGCAELPHSNPHKKIKIIEVKLIYIIIIIIYFLLKITVFSKLNLQIYNLWFIPYGNMVIKR